MVGQIVGGVLGVRWNMRYMEMMRRKKDPKGSQAIEMLYFANVPLRGATRGR
jgi:hypothetical protein